ncbi:hypothetical protein FA15DRAFT_708716 [Coprinopsis marcescibilis]|uniref:F-box domain-containing protein n=1 Tax=Coprinopsis marcescibilis TaxID=230819 RepID=A0A5C3KI94_COPMA|nr:hypothetical protein FA15DRAFT_708716 [Coprinopsis marcescibilis]
MLQNNRHLCQRVLGLEIKLANDRMESHTHSEESWIAQTLMGLSEDLTWLNSFRWEGAEIPVDSLWKSLRRNCHSLRSIATIIGEDIIDPESPLFEFSNLTHFSIQGTHRMSSPPPSKAEDLPWKLWEMLINRCPELASLYVTSDNSTNTSTVAPSFRRWFNLGPVTQGHWPSLTRLALCGEFETSQELGEFLDKHNRLKSLVLMCVGAQVEEQQCIPVVPLAGPGQLRLPKLEMFLGPHRAVMHLQQSSCLAHLNLFNDVLRDRESVHSLRQALSATRYPSLTKLEFAISDLGHATCAGDTPLGVETGSLFNVIASTCPALEELHLKCYRCPKKSLSSMLSSLSALHKIDYLTFVKPYKSFSDESVRQTAIRAIRACPSLRKVKISKCQFSSQSSRAYNMIGVEKENVKAEGIYLFSRSGKSLMRMVAHERGGFLGWDDEVRISWSGQAERKFSFDVSLAKP